MDFLFSAEAGLAGLFLASFLAATLLPGGSEVALVAFLHQHPEQAFAAWLLATMGNTLGGMSSYAMGRLIPQKLAPEKSAVRQGFRGALLRASRTGRAQAGTPQAKLVGRRGAAILLLAWAPIIGDALCVAAGWLRLPWLPCTLWMALGKGARYGVIMAGLAAL